MSYGVPALILLLTLSLFFLAYKQALLLRDITKSPKALLEPFGGGCHGATKVDETLHKIKASNEKDILMPFIGGIMGALKRYGSLRGTVYS